MPSRRELRVGDRIRLLAVPAGDLAQREREISAHTEMPGWTADIIQRILRTDPEVTIDRICEHGHPWFDYVFPSDDDVGEEHTLAILDNDSWDYCR